MRMRDTLRLFRKTLNSEVFTVSSEGTPGGGGRGELLISGVSSAETPVAGGETGCMLIFAVGSAGANEVPVCWSCIRTAKIQSTADKRILFKREGSPPWRGWAAPTEHEKVFFIHTAEDVLTTFEFTLSGEDGNHGTIKALDKLWAKIQFKIIYWTRSLVTAE